MTTPSSSTMPTRGRCDLITPPHTACRRDPLNLRQLVGNHFESNRALEGTSKTGACSSPSLQTSCERPTIVYGLWRIPASEIGRARTQ